MFLKLEQGMRYQADIALSLFESMASNDVVAKKLREAGFTDVVVTGTGSSRKATGIWSRPSMEAQLPKQIVRVWS